MKEYRNQESGVRSQELVEKKPDLNEKIVQASWGCSKKRQFF